MRCIPLITSLLISGLLFLTPSCKKKKMYCSEISIEGPDIVVEGEDIHLKVVNLPIEESLNTYYYWKFANTDGYYTFMDDMVEVYDASPVTIHKADIRDNGLYAFSIHSSNDYCPVLTAVKYVKVIPKTCPCYNSIPFDTLIIDKSFSPEIEYRSYVPILDEALTGKDFGIELGMPMFSYFMKFHFDIPIPDYSSTYTIRNHFQNGTDGLVPDDKILQVDVEFSPDNEGNVYRVAENQDNLYLKREGNYLIITFCDVLFTHKTITGRTLKISGKVRVSV